MRRRRLADLFLGVVEDLHCEAGQNNTQPEGFSPDYQICLPYSGLFVWHVAGEDVVLDPNQIVFVRGGESCRISATDAYAELIITPDLETLSEVAQLGRIGLAKHPLFTARSQLTTPRIQGLRAHFLRRLTSTSMNDLEADELVLMLLEATFQRDRSRATTQCHATALLIRRAKEFMAAGLKNRISLNDIGQAAGASPAYLTDVFRRMEGMPLHKYLVQLRLSVALTELPHANDLTTLALDLGFSSHSHFSAVFRRAFGFTPSEFRHGCPANMGHLKNRHSRSLEGSDQSGTDTQ